METNQFYGVHTALVTPMRDGKVATDDLRKLIEQQITGGVNGLVAVGTTGESPTLSHDEHNEVIRITAETADGRVPVLAGTGSNATSEAVALTREADRSQADGMLVVAPYYNKPNQEGLFRHFSAIAEVTEKPIILYSIPGRCGISIGVETCARLREKYPHVCGIKEAGGESERVAHLLQKLGPDYLVLSGDDSLTLPFMAFGAKGVISVASNLVPSAMAEITKLALENQFSEARCHEYRYHRLFNDLFCEPNPVPVKWTLAATGKISSAEVRLPLAPLSAESEARLRQSLSQLELLA